MPFWWQLPFSVAVWFAVIFDRRKNLNSLFILWYYIHIFHIFNFLIFSLDTLEVSSVPRFGQVKNLEEDNAPFKSYFIFFKTKHLKIWFSLYIVTHRLNPYLVTWTWTQKTSNKSRPISIILRHSWFLGRKLCWREFWHGSNFGTKFDWNVNFGTILTDYLCRS